MFSKLKARFQRIEARMIDDWRSSWRFWSMRLGALGLALGTIIQAAPDAALQTWTALPDDLKSVLPKHYISWVSYALIAGGLITRLFKQTPKSNG